jgi:hypothetical protein
MSAAVRLAQARRLNGRILREFGKFDAMTDVGDTLGGVVFLAVHSVVVPPELARRDERHVAVGTFERLGPSVTACMKVQVTLSGKRFPALVADKRFDLCVHRLMHIYTTKAGS